MSEKLKDNNDSFSCKRILPYPQKVNPLKDAIKNNTEMSNSIIFYKKECLSTNKEIASILMNDYPSFRKAII